MFVLVVFEGAGVREGAVLPCARADWSVAVCAAATVSRY